MYTATFVGYEDFKSAINLLLPKHPDVLYLVPNETTFRITASANGSWLALGFTTESEPGSFASDFPDAVKVDGGI